MIPQDIVHSSWVLKVRVLLSMESIASRFVSRLADTGPACLGQWRRETRCSVISFQYISEAGSKRRERWTVENEVFWARASIKLRLMRSALVGFITVSVLANNGSFLLSTRPYLTTMLSVWTDFGRLAPPHPAIPCARQP